MKCSRVGCGKEAIFVSRVPIMGGTMMAEVAGCSKEHFDEAVKSLP